jgi:hypothetical protein
LKNSASTARIFMKLHVWVFFENIEKFWVSLQFDKNNEYFTWRRMSMYDSISLYFSLNDKYFRVVV